MHKVFRAPLRLQRWRMTTKQECHICRHYQEHRPNQEKVIGGMELGSRRVRRAPERFKFPADNRAPSQEEINDEDVALGWPVLLNASST